MVCLQLLQITPTFEPMFNPGQCHNFWDSVKPDDPNICKHLALQSPLGWKSACIPCYIHGDGVEFEKDNSLLVFNWGSLLATGSSMDIYVDCCIAQGLHCQDRHTPLGHMGCNTKVDLLEHQSMFSMKNIQQPIQITRDEDGSPCLLAAGQHLTLTKSQIRYLGTRRGS